MLCYCSAPNNGVIRYHWLEPGPNDPTPGDDFYNNLSYPAGPTSIHPTWLDAITYCSRYTTNLLKPGMIADVKTVGHTTWVLNSNDRDDNCLSNILDECGTCNGEGALTWYLDRDGDGLGDVNTFTRDCFYPSVDVE